MLVKWIQCSVPDSQRSAFHNAQLRWSTLAKCSGFVAQCGGWDERTGDACILGVWKSPATYKRFMTFVHDPIVEDNEQDACYDAISVLTASALIRMRGEHPTIRKAVVDAAFLRVADCEAAPASRSRFIDRQLHIWEPAMRESPGQLGGLFSAVTDDPNRFLVTTLWRSETHHATYQTGRLPRLKSQARVDDDTLSVTGHRVPLVPEWTVVAT